MTFAPNRSEAEFETYSPDETLDMGKRLGDLLESGDVLALIGPLGAGKTILTKGIALGLGVRDSREVTSPTFVLMNVHQGKRTLYHFDAYRLKSGKQMVEIGCEEAFYGEGVSVVEWADRVADCLPADHIAVRITITGGASRAIRVSGTGIRADRIVHRLEALLGNALRG